MCKVCSFHPIGVSIKVLTIVSMIFLRLVVLSDNGALENSMRRLLDGSDLYESQHMEISSSIAYPLSVAVADMNNDGQGDVVVGSNGDNSIHIFLGSSNDNGDPTFDHVTTLSANCV